jgi:hypothetical protein
VAAVVQSDADLGQHLPDAQRGDVAVQVIAS